MSEPTPEQIAEYEHWLTEHPESIIAPDVIRGVIDDDMAEAEELEKKQTNLNREYSAKKITPAPKPKLAEKE